MIHLALVWGDIYLRAISELGMNIHTLQADLVSCWGGYVILCLRKPTSDVTLSILPPASIYLLLLVLLLTNRKIHALFHIIVHI